MVTFSTEKRSRSKPESKRNIARQERRRLRSQKHYEEKGWTWYDDPKARKEAQAQRAFPRMPGSAASEHFQQLIEQKQGEPVPADEEKEDMIEDCMAYENEKTHNCIRVIDGVAKCTLCNKQATQGHLTSTEHPKRMNEQSLGTMMVGKAQTTRRFWAEKCTGCPTVSSIQEFWGDALTHLPMVARRIHEQKGIIYHGKKRTAPSRRCKV